jgi:hypothetical protein
MFRNQPTKVSSTALRESGVIAKSPGIKKPFLKYVHTNLIDVVRQT